ncbi:MAG TPA: hypothetical protein VM009_01430, partial [Terriglobales bacterium]|nr:hypothetical protein [Terriglobales bacterium]
ACTNLVRAVYCDHISLAKARIMMRAITEANLSLRRGSILSEYRQPVLEMDPEPIPALGDEDGCVLPEQRGLKQAIVEGRRANAERADAEIAAARARGESPAPRPLTPEEQKAATVKAQRAAQNEAFEREFLQMCTDAEAAGLLTDTMRHQRSRIEAKRSSQVAQPPSAVKAPTAVTQPPSTLISRTVSGTARLQSCDTPPLLSPLSSRASHEGLLSDESRDHASAVAFGGSTGLQASEKQHHKNGASAPNPAQAREPVPQLRSKGTRLSAVPITTGA